MCKVSAIIPFYNAETYLAEAIESILGQSHKNLELILVNDASTDQSKKIAEKYVSDQVRLITNSNNSGVAVSLNRALAACSGDFIARMDADDVSLPNRFKKQVAFMERNPHIGVCGSWVRHIGKYEGVLERKPIGSSCIHAFMMLDNPIMHPTVMMRRSLIDEHGLQYNASFERCEDFELWERVAHLSCVDNIPEPLVKFRVHKDSVTAKFSDEVWTKTHDVLERGLRRIGVSTDATGMEFHRKVSHGEPASNLAELRKAEKWFLKLCSANRQAKTHADDAMLNALGFAWFAICKNSSMLGLQVWNLYNKSALSRGAPESLMRKILLGALVCLQSVRRLDCFKRSKGR